MTRAVGHPRAGRREWVGLGVIALPCLLYAMDLTVLNLALPQLSADLQPTSSQLLWIVDIYGFLAAGSLVTMGTLGDRIGRRRLLLIGAAAFGTASVLAASSTSAGMLIAARALLGVAGATLAPSTLSLIRAMFADPGQRALAVGVWISSFSAGAAVGPVLGGLLLESFWWGSVFLIAVPVMALLLVLGPLLLPEFRDPDAGRLDLPSAALSLAAVLAVIYGLKQLAQGAPGWVPWVSVLAGLVLGVVFVRRQHSAAHPLLDLSLFANHAFSDALVTNTLDFFVSFGALLFIAQYLQLVLGLSPLEAGLWMVPSAVGLIAGSMLAPVLVRWVRPWSVMAAGLGGGGAAPGGAAELGEAAEEAAAEVGGAEVLQHGGHHPGVEAAGAGGDLEGDVVADGHQLPVALVGGPLGDQGLGDPGAEQAGHPGRVREGVLDALVGGQQPGRGDGTDALDPGQAVAGVAAQGGERRVGGRADPVAGPQPARRDLLHAAPGDQVEDLHGGGDERERVLVAGGQGGRDPAPPGQGGRRPEHVVGLEALGHGHAQPQPAQQAGQLVEQLDQRVVLGRPGRLVTGMAVAPQRSRRVVEPDHAGAGPGRGPDPGQHGQDPLAGLPRRPVDAADGVVGAVGQPVAVDGQQHRHRPPGPASLAPPPCGLLPGPGRGGADPVGRLVEHEQLGGVGDGYGRHATTITLGRPARKVPVPGLGTGLGRLWRW